MADCLFLLGHTARGASALIKQASQRLLHFGVALGRNLGVLFGRLRGFGRTGLFAKKGGAYLFGQSFRPNSGRKYGQSGGGLVAQKKQLIVQIVVSTGNFDGFAQKLYLFFQPKDFGLKSLVLLKIHLYLPVFFGSKRSGGWGLRWRGRRLFCLGKKGPRPVRIGL